MRTKKTTLSFLTESKASHVSLSSFRRVAITLLVMLLTTASAIAQNNYWLTLDPNYEGGASTMVPVSINANTITLTQNFEPTRTGYTFYGWSDLPTGVAKYRTGDKVTLDGNLTLYAVWYILNYTINGGGNKQVELSGYEGEKPSGTLNIPATVTINGIEYSVTSIGEKAFENCDNLQSVTIPKSVTSIGNDAFSWCESLQSVTILDGVKSIGNEAFMNCSSLESVTIPNSVTRIGFSAFYDCSNLQSVTILDGVKSIGNGAFMNCSSLESVTIPNSVTNIEVRTFSGCFNLQSVTIPNSVTSIGNFAFRSCSDLQSVTIPNSVTSIGIGAFYSCSRLQSVTINGNPKIGGSAFGETPATVTMNLTASNVNGAKWTTFYNNGYNFEADENTTVYKGTVNESSLMLTEVEDKIVNRGTAVILKSTGNPVMTLTESNSSDTNGNYLYGVSDRYSRTSIITFFNADAIYTMGNTSAGFGFHRYTGEYVPAQKAFLPLNTSDGAKAQSLSIVFAIGTTGINSVSSDSNVQNDWFSLDGTRLSGKPSQPGIYVNGKKKIVIK